MENQKREGPSNSLSADFFTLQFLIKSQENNYLVVFKCFFLNARLMHVFNNRFILLKAFASMGFKRVTESFQIHKKCDGRKH